MTTNSEIQQKIIEDQPLDYGSRATPSFTQFLALTNISLAVSSYDTHRVIVLRTQANQLNTDLIPVMRPRGLAYHGDTLAIASLHEVIQYQRADALLPQLALEHADALFLPTHLQITGELNIHDLAFGQGDLWLVNTRFSCLATLAPQVSFKPQWQPFFLSQLQQADSCHLNGMAMAQGKAKFVSCFGQFVGNPDARYQDVANSGLIIEVERNQIFANGLTMPHSPTLHNGYLYVCNSGLGQVLRYKVPPATAQLAAEQPKLAQSELVTELPGFCRGLTFIGQYMLVACSLVRPSEKLAANAICERLQQHSVAGLFIYDLQQQAVVAQLEFTGDVGQLYDIAIIPNARYPHIVGPTDKVVRDTFIY